MTSEIAFLVEGTPVAQPRPRFSARLSKNADGEVSAVGHAHSAEGPIDGWKMAIRYAARRYQPKTPILGPVQVNCSFFFPRPKSHFRKGQLKETAPLWHTARNDLDNLLKPPLDILTELGFWKDDGQVCVATVSKHFDDIAGAMISIQPITSDALQPNNPPEPAL